MITLKEELVATDKAAELISKRYENAKKLEELTDQQLGVIKLALESKSWKDVIVGLFWGFLSGVGSSLSASVLYNKWKKKKAIQ